MLSSQEMHKISTQWERDECSQFRTLNVQNFQAILFTTEVLCVQMEGMRECRDVTQFFPKLG